MEIRFTTQVFKEGKMYVAYAPELDVSSCGKSLEEAKENLREAVEIFLEETQKTGTLYDILEEAGFTRENKKRWIAPEVVSLEKTQLAI